MKTTTAIVSLLALGSANAFTASQQSRRTITALASAAEMDGVVGSNTIEAGKGVVSSVVVVVSVYNTRRRCRRRPRKRNLVL